MYKEYYLDGPSMKSVDQYAIECMGIPSLVLMERAAYEVTQLIKEQTDAGAGTVLILAGMGNNGADGLAVARMLTDSGYDALVLMVGKESSATPEWIKQKEILDKMGILCLSYKQLGKGFLEYIIKNHCGGKPLSLMVDGLFGIGLSRELGGDYPDLVAEVNESGIPVIAIDIPSGVLSGTGQIAGCAIRCSHTVTFGRKKLGCILYPGAEYCGKLICKDVGFTRPALEQAGFQAWGFGGPEELMQQKDLLKKRPAQGHKGSFGKLLVIAGCKTMAGAAVFAGGGAMRMGTGLVKIFSPLCNRDVLLTKLPEAILSLYDDGYPDLELLKRDLAWADAVVIGPGLGQEAYVTDIMETVLKESIATDGKKGLPVVIDADGLRCLAGLEELKKCLHDQIIYTPHLGEMAALAKTNVGNLQEKQLGSCVELAKNLGGVVVMKQATSVISVQGQTPCLVTSGCNALATAGSGDVLAGMIGALCAEGYPVEAAAYLGAYFHGLVGSIVGTIHGNRSVCASDLVEGIGDLMKLLDE